MKRALLLPLGVFAALLLLLGAGLQVKPGELPSPFIGKPAPGFSLAVLNDPQQRFTPQELRGQVWVLNAWASWCGPCRQELPALQALSRQAGVPIVGLNYKDKPEDGARFLARNGNPYRVSALDADGRVGIDYGVYGLPETFVIDRQGVIRFKHVGALTPEVIRERFLPLIRDLRREPSGA